MKIYVFLSLCTRILQKMNNKVEASPWQEEEKMTFEKYI